MIPAPFEYHRATSIDEALRLLQQFGPEAKVLAGGHSLIPIMKLRLARPAHIIDIGRIDALRYIREEGDTVVIGALSTHTMVAESNVVRRRTPVLAQAAAQIGDVQVRNMGTIGGSLAHADPAADYPAAVLAADADIVVQGPRGRRTIRATDFFVDLFTTAMQPDELLIEVRVPAMASKTGTSYQKFAHPASGFAVVGCAAIVTVDGGTFQDVRLAFTGLTRKAFRDTAVEDALRGQPANETSIRVAVEKAAQGITPLSDTFASSEYRKHLAKVYAHRALSEALARVS